MPLISSPRNRGENESQLFQNEGDTFRPDDDAMQDGGLYKRALPESIYGACVLDWLTQKEKDRSLLLGSAGIGGILKAVGYFMATGTIPSLFISYLLQFGFAFHVFVTVGANGLLGGDFDVSCQAGDSMLRVLANVSFLMLVCS